MRKIMCFLLLFALLLGISPAALALDTSLHVYDDADLLTDEEEADLAARIDVLRDELGMELVIVTTDDSQGKSAQEYAEDFYDDNGFGYGAEGDGLLLLVAMDLREYWTCTTGRAEAIFDSWNLDRIHEDMSACLSDGAYWEGFSQYLSAVESVVLSAEEESDAPEYMGSVGTDDDNFYGDDYYYEGTYLDRDFWSRALGTLPIVIGLSAVIAGLIVWGMSRSHKMVKHAVSASSYVAQDALKLRVNSDTFLRSHTTTVRVAPPPPGHNFSGGGGGGHSHGGGGGRF